ncbi:MAG: septal ring lytic transglycosylase RlpA family protein, partial [Treponema sp.]|nr:septal ring lytic transglycosylase RlpA family protein [Treponema sp.]
MKLVCKRVAIVPFFLLAIGMLVGDSIWEGTAVVAPDGVLPDAGYYAAANFFPKDTTVIVTNLENGKIVHVTVVATLDNSSVLMLLSKEAADAIALSANYPGRVRVMEAVDPVTMLPPLENKISNGDPDYDPMARINAIPPDSAAPEDGPPALAEGAAPDADALGGGVAAAPEDGPPALAEG